jgi:hypothetical protein
VQSKVDKELKTEQDVTASLVDQLEQTLAAQEHTRAALADTGNRSAAKATALDAERKAARTRAEVRWPTLHRSWPSVLTA